MSSFSASDMSQLYYPFNFILHDLFLFFLYFVYFWRNSTVLDYLPATSFDCLDEIYKSVFIV